MYVLCLQWQPCCSTADPLGTLAFTLTAQIAGNTASIASGNASLTAQIAAVGSNVASHTGQLAMIPWDVSPVLNNDSDAVWDAPRPCNAVRGLLTAGRWLSGRGVELCAASLVQPHMSLPQICSR